MKKFLLSGLLAALLLSCKTSPKVVSFFREDKTLMYYLMPVESKGRNFSFFSADLTFFFEGEGLKSDTTANYSIVLKEQKKADSASAGLIVADRKIRFEKKEVLHKKAYGKKQVLVRFTSVIPQEASEILLRDSGKVKFFVEDEGFFEEFYCGDFQEMLDELRLII